MFVSPNLVFLEMPKTASTHVRHLLAGYEPGTLERKHGALSGDKGRRLVVACVRDPWDWYVSMWAFGCRGRGELFRQMTGLRHGKALAKAVRDRRPDRMLATVAGAGRSLRLGREREAWRRVYADPYDPALFREWLTMLLDAERKALLPWGYGRSGTRRCAGPMTYLFLSLATESAAWAATGRRIADGHALRGFLDRHLLLDRTLRLERLEHDLAALLQALGHAVTPDELARAGRANASARRSVADYYDAETAALVARHEWLLIETYGYRAPARPGDGAAPAPEAPRVPAAGAGGGA